MLQKNHMVEVREVLQDGIIFVRINYILTIMIKAPILATCFVILTLSSFIHYANGSQKVLDFTIYADGTTHVLYQTDVDPQSPDYVLNLYGVSIENLIVQDENGTLLSSKVNNDNTVTIETLGSSTIKADYDTEDLISKNGKTWTFHVNSPIDYSVLLPKNTVIVGITSSPLNMQIIDDQSLISLQNGSSEINYVIGVLGTSQTASLAIQKAQDFINTLNSEGAKTPLALAKLEEAQSNFDQGKYSDAESMANSAKGIALQEQQTGNPKAPTFDNLLTILIVGSIIAIGAATGFLIMSKKKRVTGKISSSNQNLNNVDIPSDRKTLYKPNLELRQDDQEIVSFINEKGGQVFESELRKKFLMPRTTMWRAVKRLEREEIVEVEKVDKQNLIKLRHVEESTE